MNWFKKIFSAISKYFKTGKAASDAQKALEYVAKALPYVVIVGDFITASPLPQLVGIPNGIDDAVWLAIKKKFPNLLDGSVKTPDEVKADALVVVTELLKAKYPELSTSVARAAAQLAYLDYKAGATADSAVAP